MQDETECDPVRVLGSLARRLDVEQDLTTTLEAITHAVVATVHGVDYAGISWSGRRRVTAQAPTSELVSYCDQLQSDLGEGPCLQAIRSQDTIIVEDLADEDRWPAFAPRAAGIGMRSMISFQLFAERDTIGVLNLYATVPGQFGGQARIVGELFASYAAVVLSGKKREDQLTEALATRDVIGQAKGLLMAREKLTGEQAFQQLVRSSQDNNIKLAEVARWLVDDHESPDQAV